MTISELNLWLSAGPLIIPLQSLLIRVNGLRSWYRRPPARLLQTATVLFADGEGSSCGCAVAAGVDLVDKWHMQWKLKYYHMEVREPCIVSDTMCIPVLHSPSVKPWHYLRSFGYGLNDTVNIYCMGRQTVLGKWRNSCCVRELVSA